MKQTDTKQTTIAQHLNIDTLPTSMCQNILPLIELVDQTDSFDKMLVFICNVDCYTNTNMFGTNFYNVNHRKNYVVGVSRRRNMFVLLYVDCMSLPI